MDNYICKIATREEKLAKLEYDKSINPGEEENWDTWINEFKNRPEGERITYIGLLNNKIICEVSAALVSNGIANSDGLVDIRDIVKLNNYRINKAESEKNWSNAEKVAFKALSNSNITNTDIAQVVLRDIAILNNCRLK